MLFIFYPTKNQEKKEKIIIIKKNSKYKMIYTKKVTSEKVGGLKLKKLKKLTTQF